MLLRIRFSAWLLALALVPIGASSSLATSFALVDLVGGLSFTTAHLTFSGFSATVTGALSTDLTDYVVESLPGSDGFNLIGPIGVADGEVGDLVLSYEIWADPGAVIEGGELFFVGGAMGVGAAASVAELWLDAASTLFVGVTGGGGMNLFDSASFAPLQHLSIIKDIMVDSTLVEGGLGGLASISLVQQTFQVVPEPAALALLAPGLAGLAWFSRRRV